MDGTHLRVREKKRIFYDQNQAELWYLRNGEPCNLIPTQYSSVYTHLPP